MLGRNTFATPESFSRTGFVYPIEMESQSTGRWVVWGQSLLVQQQAFGATALEQQADGDDNAQDGANHVRNPFNLESVLTAI